MTRSAVSGLQSLAGAVCRSHGAAGIRWRRSLKGLRLPRGPNPHDRHSLAGGSLKRSLGMVLRGAGTCLPPTANHPQGLRP
jgi:hypothetical protein